MQNINVSKNIEASNKFDAPVSRLVRDVLEDTFNMVMNIGANVGTLVGDVMGDVESIVGRFINVGKGYFFRNGLGIKIPFAVNGLPPEMLVDDVPAWQALITETAVTCAKCSGGIVSGYKAYISTADSKGDRMFLCGECLDRLGKN